ncbi:hypothetical protein ACFONE_08555 [Xanthomonas dyei]|uniref:hypothetical protein n=1 Tax=Xanthomonas dyei TaxID=743699 RepID=UPI00361A4266
MSCAKQQLATLATLRRDREQRDALRTQEDAWRRADATRASSAGVSGDEVEIVDSALSPDGRHLLVVTQAKNADEGQAGKMPKYVTESGYEEFQETRSRVGRNAPVAHALWLVDVVAGSARQLSFDALPGIATDPLAALRKAAKRDALKGNRAVRVESDGDGSGPAVHWSDDGRNVAVEIRAVDNKDRWIASVDLDSAKLQPRHRLSDSAWINWDFNDFSAGCPTIAHAVAALGRIRLFAAVHGGR